MKRDHFQSWARPGEFHALLNKHLGRKEEARDSARVALYTPWWTLKSGFTSMAELAQFPPDAESVHRQLSEVAKASQGGALPPGIAVAVKTDEQVEKLRVSPTCRTPQPLPPFPLFPPSNFESSLLHKSRLAFSNAFIERATSVINTVRNIQPLPLDAVLDRQI